MDFKNVAGMVVKVAPLFAGLLGGPVGAGVGLAAKLLGSLFGTEPEPGPIMEAIKADPEALVKVRELELAHQRELVRYTLEAETNQMVQQTAQIQAINQTMQAESKSEHWPQYSWRPFIGFCTGIAFIELVSLIGWLAYEAIIGAKPEAIGMIPQTVMAFTGLFAIPGAILGVSAWYRGKTKHDEGSIAKQKQSQAGGATPGIIEEARNIIANVVLDGDKP